MSPSTTVRVCMSAFVPVDQRLNCRSDESCRNFRETLRHSFENSGIRQVSAKFVPQLSWSKKKSSLNINMDFAGN